MRSTVLLKEPPRESPPGAGGTRRPRSRSFNYHVKEVRKKLHDATDKLADGHMSVDGWADQFHAALVGGHTEAWMLGRQRAGDHGAKNKDDHTMGREAADGESDFLDRFIQALKDKDPRYFEDDGAVRPDAIKARQDLYAQKLRGTANNAFVGASEDDEQFHWHLGGAEEHCEDCPRIAALSPFTKDTLFATPCSCDTECLGNCKCYLERESDGETGFKAVNLE